MGYHDDPGYPSPGRPAQPLRVGAPQAAPGAFGERAPNSTSLDGRRAAGFGERAPGSNWLPNNGLDIPGAREQLDENAKRLDTFKQETLAPVRAELQAAQQRLSALIASSGAQLERRLRIRTIVLTVLILVSFVINFGLIVYLLRR